MNPLPAGPFDVIYADPPWRFKTYSAKGKGRSAENHYECMSAEELQYIPVFDVLAQRAVLYLWATAPMLKIALDVMEEWGFEYKTNAVWVKDRIGTGYRFRNRHEHLLVGTTRNASGMCPKPGNRVDSVISGQQRQHSRKPDRAREIIDRYHPESRKLEMFARTQAPGWTAWGNEVGRFES